MSTPLPPSTIGAGAVYTPSGSPFQQARAESVAHFASVPNDGIGNDVLAKSHRAIPTSGRLIASNALYTAYAVKKGLVRVMKRQTNAKTLLRGHSDQTRIVDAAFFGTEGTAQRKEGVSALWNQLCAKNVATNNDGGGGNAPQHAPPAAASDLLATVGGMKDSACVLIWKITSGTDGNDELGAQKLYELRYPHATRIVWHPFNPNRFLLLTRTYDDAEWDNSPRSVASIVETSKLKTTMENGHSVCECGSDKVLDGTSQLFVTAKENTGANDVSWSHVKDARHVITGHDDGKVRLWDVTKTDGLGVTCVHELDVTSGVVESPDKRVTRVLFLSQYESNGSNEALTPPFIVGTEMNQVISLWSSFPSNGDAPQRLRVFRLADVGSSFVNVELCPAPYRPPVSSSSPPIPSSFLLLAERQKGCVHALHIETEWKKDTSSVVVKGFDYVNTLNVVHPVYSFCIAPKKESGASVGNEKDVELSCIQSKAVQLLTLSAAMCAAPSKDAGGRERGDLANGVTLIELPTEVSDEEAEAFEDFEDEDYDMDDDVEFSTNHTGGDDGDVQDDPVVPTATAEEPNAFSNWLGAIANPIPVPSASPPPVPAAQTPPVAAKPKSTTPPPPGLGFPTILPTPPDSTDSQFLSPMQILSGSSNETKSKAEGGTKGKQKKKESSKKAQTTAASVAPVAILKREEPKNEIPAAPSSVSQQAADSSSGAGLEDMISSYMKSHGTEMAAVLRKAVAAEVETAVQSNMKGVEKAAEKAVQRALAADGKFEKKMEKQAKESAAMAAKEAVAAMQVPIVNSLQQVMREVMIPAYESATRQMFVQISSSVEKGLAAQKPASDANSSASLEAMTEQMMKMSVAIQTLSNEVAELRGEVKSGGKANGAAQQTQQTSKMESIKTEISALCQSNRYEEAFTKAVSASDGEIALFVCKNADSSAVFGGDSVAISQPILICLMQQLGAILVSTTDAADFKILLAWLQDVAVTIDPTDANIQKHVRPVVQQLLVNINNKMANCDHSFRRPLQTLNQVIRGLAL